MMTTETTTETAPAVDTSSDDALIAQLESGGDDEEAPEAAPAEPAPAETPPPPPAEDPIAAIEARRAEVLAQRQQAEREAQQAKARTETETAAERARAAMDADRQLLLSDPIAFAERHGLDKKALLERLVKDGSNPAAAEVRRIQAEAESKLSRENAELRKEIEALKSDTQQWRGQMVYQQDLGIVQSMATPDTFPILARTDPQERLAEVYRTRTEYEGVDLGPDPVRTLLQITERSLRQRAERYASLLAGQAPGATTKTPASGASGTTSSGQPASRTITNELAASPAGKRPPPQTDEERDAEALRILGD